MYPFDFDCSCYHFNVNCSHQIYILVDYWNHNRTRSTATLQSLVQFRVRQPMARSRRLCASNEKILSTSHQQNKRWKTSRNNKLQEKVSRKLPIEVFFYDIIKTLFMYDQKIRRRVCQTRTAWKGTARAGWSTARKNRTELRNAVHDTVTFNVFMTWKIIINF